jgi:hypothetical protein
MAKKPLERPDLKWSNAQVADAIAFDGSHFEKHGIKDFNLQTPAQYSQLIKDTLDNPNTYGFAGRVAPLYLNYFTERKTPEFSTQTFYNPEQQIIITTHLKVDKSGKMTVNGTAHPARHGEKTYSKRMEAIARDGNHPILQLKNESTQFQRLAQKQMGGRDAIVAAKLNQLAPDMVGKKLLTKIGSHLLIIGPAIAAGLTKLLGGTNAEAKQAATDSAVGLRVATAPNGHEAVVRALGDGMTGAVEEGVRWANDVAKSFGGGDPKIDSGVVRNTAQLVGTGIRTGWDKTFGSKEGPSFLPLEIEKITCPDCAGMPLPKFSTRYRGSINAPLVTDIPKEGAHTASPSTTRKVSQNSSANLKATPPV